MTEIFFCEKCGHCNRVDEDQLSVHLERLEAACAASNIAVDHLGTVSTEGAAKLLGRSVRTLESWRSQGIGPVYLRGGKIRYALTDLAEFLAHGLRDFTRK